MHGKISPRNVLGEMAIKEQLKARRGGWIDKKILNGKTGDPRGPQIVYTGSRSLHMNRRLPSMSKLVGQENSNLVRVVYANIGTSKRAIQILDQMISAFLEGLLKPADFITSLSHTERLAGTIKVCKESNGLEIIGACG